MDVVVIFNGLGNQMSQYALYLQKKAIDESTRFIIDKRFLSNHNGYELDNVFNIDYKDNFINSILFLLFRILCVKKYPLVSKPILKFFNFLGVSLLEENKNYDYDEKLLKSSKGIRFLYGGWHSEKYFIHYKQQIADVYKFNIDQTDTILQKYLNKIKMLNSVSIHVRRGDYMKGQNFELFGSVCTQEYFKVAINEIHKKVDNPHFFIFSNDIKWVKENLKINNYTIVDCNNGKNSWKDMFLISNCKHNINSNSTFSWWASWLNINEDKLVLVPQYFINNFETKDFYPAHWKKIIHY